MRMSTAPVLSQSNSPGQRERQRIYLDALATLPDLHIHYGYFLIKSYSCPMCGASYDAYEEKMTDVNIATEMLGDANGDIFDTAIIISGDSDLSGPVTAIRERYPQKRVIVAFPPNRTSFRLRQAANASFTIGRRRIAASLLPERIDKADGFVINKPPRWS